MAKAILVDSTKCTACRGCQVACKQWNNLEAEETVNPISFMPSRALMVPAIWPHTWAKPSRGARRTTR